MEKEKRMFFDAENSKRLKWEQHLLLIEDSWQCVIKCKALSLLFSQGECSTITLV